MNTFVLNLDPVIHLTDEQFSALCSANQDLKFERTTQGELVIVSPVGGKGGRQEADLIGDLVLWNRQTGLGYVFSSSTIFNLPNGGDRSPDAAWVKSERWEALTPEEQEGFPPICPDFVIELRSRTDRTSVSPSGRASGEASVEPLRPLQEKMQEYLDNNLRLGWLIDPQERQVEIYRLGQPVEVIKLPASLSGEDVLPEFVLHLP